MGDSVGSFKEICSVIITTDKEGNVKKVRDDFFGRSATYEKLGKRYLIDSNEGCRAVNYENLPDWVKERFERKFDNEDIITKETD